MQRDKNYQDNHSRRVALITGGAQRIGRSIAIALHRRKIDILIHCNQSMVEAAKLVQDFNQQRRNSAQLIQLDLSSSDSPKQLISQSISHFGRLDYLVNNASIFYPTPFLDLDYELSIERFIRVNFATPVKLMQLAKPYLSSHNGAILNLIDIYANSGLLEHTCYVASKSALQQISKQLALEFAPEVRVNGISPGAILWPDGPTLAAVHEQQKAKDKQEVIVTNTALKRKGCAEDISTAAEFLLLDADYITGQTIAVDGGRQLYI